MLGSGAAGLRAAVELKRRGVDVVVATQNLYGGTSACSGSDKQTLHTASGSGRGDDFDALAAALGAGGAMDEDTAYVEAVGSLPALASLQFMGLPVPLDAYGAVLRYKTDHDEAGRATSCGPRTSRLMVRALAEESARLGVPVVNRSTAAQILVDQGRVVGLLALQFGRPNNRQSVRPRRLPLRYARHRGGRSWRALPRQRLSQALLRRARPRARGRHRSRELDREPVRHRHPSGWLPLEPVGHLRAMPALHLFHRRKRRGAQFSRRLLSDDSGAGVEYFPQRLSMAVPCLAHARLRLQPGRSRDFSRDPGRSDRSDGLQPQSRAGSRRRAVLAGSARRRRPRLSRQQRSAAAVADSSGSRA